MATINEAVRQMYLEQTGREADPKGLEYFVNRFGADIDPEELYIFKKMAAEEVAANDIRKEKLGTPYSGPLAMGLGDLADIEARNTTTNTAPAGMSITQAYQQVLGRTPSASEIAYWTSQYGSSVDPTELSSFSVASQPERAAAPNTNDAIRQMYKQVVGREPDASGLKYFSDRFGTDVDANELAIFKGMSAQEINANAAKAAGTTTSTAPAGMSISQAYQQVLGRTPSASELAYWTSKFGADVDAKELSSFSVAAQPERAAVPTTNNAVRQMYLSVLGREPDASGLKYFSDRFGADVDASELGIFKGMSSQELAANAARNAGTTTNKAGAINRPTTQSQVTGTQLAPAQVTNTAIAGTPYTSVYTPATMQQNAPTLASIQAAAQSSNPYQSLMALTPQRSMPASYTGLLGTTTANTNLGGFDPKIYNPPITAVTTTTGGGGGGGGGGNDGSQKGSAWDSMSNADKAAFYAANPTFSAITQAGQKALSFLGLTNPLQEAIAKGTPAFSVDPGNPDAGSARSDSSNDGGGGARAGGDQGATGGGYQAKGGLITPREVKGPNPPGPDDGYTGLDIGEYVIRKSAVKKYGANIFEQINAGRIPAQRLKSLLE